MQTPGKEPPDRPGEPEGRFPTALKVEMALRQIRGETLAELSRETGRPRKQLSAWRRRFLAGGEAALDGPGDPGELDALRAAREELTARVATLEREKHELGRRVALLGRGRSARAPTHPFCSREYALAQEEPGVRARFVPEWGTHVLVRETAAGHRQAAGVRPVAPLAPDADVRAGLDALHGDGIATVSLVTDPLWRPELAVLQDAFDSCRPFKESYFVDRAADAVHLRKRHRNTVNRVRRVTDVREVDLGEHLGRWQELYAGNVESRRIAQPFGPAYFERLAAVPGLRTLAVLVAGEIVTMTLWVRHQDILYYHDGASSTAGFDASASYAAFAEVVEGDLDARYIVLGGAAHFTDERDDGLAVFKRGFANASAQSYLCSARRRAGRA